ncbi:MAG: VWA domain-containing protein [Deltaproteobacteria bacterium]|nr:VWA domain-containing protein [Deltaproteobacteria bacterium]
MKKKVSSGSLTIMLLLTFIVSGTSAHAAQFSADLIITGPDVNYTFKLYVKENMYRLEKVKGGMKYPPFPTIVNRNTGLTWGLNPQMKQYVEMNEPEKTMMMNPLMGWAMTRKGMTISKGGKETIGGYDCQTFEYREPGQSQVAAKVWVGLKLDFDVKEVRYATNGNAVMELKTIREGLVEDSLFNIPSGYTKVTMSGGPAPDAAPAKPSVTAPAPQPAPKSPSAAPAGNLIFILDASGSMWGQVQGKAKIAIAKEVLTDLIEKVPDDAIVGLVVYGHRRKGDCNDVEELVPLGPIDKGKLIKEIQALSPKGKTPITLSVRKTAEKIKHLEDETTIILVSDGKETCEGDPCALVKELKAAGIKFVMHVIGFDVTEEEKVQLECMAQAGGGEYFTAKTAKDFQMAATKVVKKAQEFGVLKMIAMKNGKPLHAWVEIHESGTEKIVRRDTTSGETGIRKIKLPAGKYDVLVRDTESVSGGEMAPVRFSGVTIELRQTVEKRADFSDGTLVIKAIKNDKPVEAQVFYYRSKETKSFFNEATHPKTGETRRKFVPGPYDIKVVDYHTAGKPSINLRGIEVLSGETIEKTAEFANGSLKILTTRNGEPVFCPVKIFDSEGKVISDFWTQHGERTVQLLQGTYDVEVKLMDIPGGNPVIRFRGLEISARGTEERTANFKIGFLTVSATLDGKPFNTPVKLYKESSKSNLGHWTSGGSRTFPLVPGVYNAKVVSIQDNKQFKAFEGIKIEAGKTISINAAFPVSPPQTKTIPERKPQAAQAAAPVAAKPPARALITDIAARYWPVAHGVHSGAFIALP